MAFATEAQTSTPPTILKCKEPYTALALAPNAQFIVTGSQEGVIRSYLLPSTKVHRAVKSLGDEISSVVLETANNAEILPRFWVACGRRVRTSRPYWNSNIERITPQALLFNVNTETLVLNDENAVENISLIDDGAEDECLNQVRQTVPTASMKRGYRLCLSR